MVGVGIGPRPHIEALGDSGASLSFRFRGQGLDDRLTFSRSGLASMWLGDDNVLGWAPHNLLLQSNDLDTTWTNTRSVDAEVSDDSPSVTDTCWRITDDSLTGSATVLMLQGVALPDNATSYRFSVYAKADQLNFIRLGTLNFDSAADTWFNLSDGTVGTSTHTSAAISSDGNGWYRCSVEFSSSSDLSGHVGIFLAESDNVANVTRDGTSSVLVAGAQLNKGALQSYNATTTAAYYGPRLETPSWGAESGLVLEAGRTNGITYSNDFSNAAWTKGSNQTQTQDATGPDGTTSAWTLADDNSTGTGTVYVADGGITVASGSNTVSIYAKASGVDYIAIRTLNFDASGDGTSYFDVAGGTVASKSANHTYATIESAGTFYRCSITFATTGDLTGDLLFYLSQDGSTTTVDRDGTSSAILYGAQGESGQMMSSYIPTGTGTVARAVESCTYTLPSALATALETEGTVLARCDFEGGTAPFASNRTLMAIRDPGNTNRHLMSNISGGPGLYVQAAGSLEVFQNASAENDNTVFKWAFGWKLNDTNMAVNGTKTTVDGTCTMPTGMDTLVLGANAAAGTNALFGRIYSFKLWDKRKTDAQLQTIST